jgi:hypothetical protein
MKDLLSALAKKKKTSLPAPEKVSTHFTTSAPSSPPLQKPQTHKAQPKTRNIQARRAQYPKVKPVLYQAKAKQQHAQAYRNEDFQFVTNVDNAGVNIAVRFRGSQIFQFLLPTTEYELWQKMSSFWTNRYQHVQMKVPLNAFMNDNSLVHSVIKTIVNILDTLFMEARKQAPQEAHQAQSHQSQQQQQQQRRRV